MTAAHLDRYDHDERDMSIPQPEPLELPMHFPQPNGGMPSFRLYSTETPEDLPESLCVAYGIIGELSHHVGSRVRFTREQIENFARGKWKPFGFDLVGVDAMDVAPRIEEMGS